MNWNVIIVYQLYFKIKEIRTLVGLLAQALSMVEGG